jgi:uncharacterized protein (TIGR03437 family)
VNAGSVATSVAGVQVTFDGTPAPLLYVGAGEIGCMVPFEIAGQAFTTMQVTYNGAKSNPVQVPVNPGAVEVLTVLNQDFTVNSMSNPGQAGSIMSLYLTGAGQTNPPSTDGSLSTVPLPMPVGAVTVMNNTPAPLRVTFAGAAYGLPAGILQVNFQAPQQSATNMTAGVGLSFGYFNVYVQ